MLHRFLGLIPKMYIIKHDFVKKYHAFLMFRKDLELLNLLWILYKTKTATYISRCFLAV